MNDEQDTRRYFLFTYATQTTLYGVSMGNVLVAFEGFPSNLWLVEEAIPKQAPYIKKGIHIVITGFVEFKSKEDFDSYTGGYNMGDEISKALGL